MGYIFSKSLRTTLVMFLSAFLLLSSKGFSDDGFDPISVEKRPSWLFVQTAESGSLKKIKGEPGSYLLKLKGVSPCMVSFTDRPAKDALIGTTGNFVKKWYNYLGTDNYRDTPPNGSLVFSPNGFKEVLVLCLENPKYDRKNHTLTYKVQPIQVSNRNKEKHLHYPSLKKMPKKFHKVVLFIDDSWGSLGG